LIDAGTAAGCCVEGGRWTVNKEGAMANVAKPVVLEGPPFGQFVDPDEAYVRAQGESLGSGLLGGWSQANLGGFFEEQPSKEIREEIRGEIRRLVRAGLREPATGAAGKR
jgi:hypothetical protein